MTYRIGFDIGSTTIKAVVMDDNGTILYKSYERHMAQVRAKGAEDPRFLALADIVDAHNGLWCPEAEEYLLAHWVEEE